MKSEERRATDEVPDPGPGASLSPPDTAPQGSSGYLLLPPVSLFLAAPNASSSQMRQSLMRETIPQQNQQLAGSSVFFFFFFFAVIHSMWFLVPRPRMESVLPTVEAGS